MKKMDVTILSSFPPLRGMSKYSAALVRGFSSDTTIEALGFKSMYPAFLYPTKTKDSSLKKLDDPNVFERSFLTWYNPLTWVYAGLTFKGRTLHVQWWHFALAPVFITIMVIAKIRRVRVLTTVHNVEAHEESKLQKMSNKLVYGLTDQFIVHTKSNKTILARSVKKPIQVVPHGILKPDAKIRHLSKEKSKEIIGLDKSNKTILYFGIIREYKGLDILIKSFATVAQKEPAARLVIAGKPWSGEDWNNYEKLLVQHGVSEKTVRKIGYIGEDELEPLFEAADIVVFPYKHFEAQSGAASMAIYFKKAIIVSNVGGLPDYVENDVSVFEPNNVDDLSDKILTVIKNPSLQKELEEVSSKKLNELSWEKIAEKTSEYY